MEENNNRQTESNDLDINADSDIPGTTHLSNPQDGADPVEKLSKDLSELQDKYVRLQAEFDNARKRYSREKLELIENAGERILASLLEVMDDMDRAEKQMESLADAEKIKEGDRLIFAKFRNKMMSHGLKIMESVGEPFDTEKHTAVTMVKAGPDRNGLIIDELEKGYYLKEKVLRFAKVVVGD